MRRTHRALAALALGLALVGATTVVAAAAAPPKGTPDLTDQREALYQSELERNLQLRTQAGDEVAVGHGWRPSARRCTSRSWRATWQPLQPPTAWPSGPPHRPTRPHPAPASSRPAARGRRAAATAGRRGR